MALVEHTLEDHVAIVTMNQDDNRLNPSFIDAFLDVLDKLDHETDARTLVVTSSHEKIFSNGLDLEWLLPAFRKQHDDTIKDFFVRINKLFSRILLYPMVTIAAISGHAFAGGAILACAFDFRFMRTDRGYFCLNEVELGIPLLPGMNSLLKKAIPLNTLVEMELTGKRLTAQECKSHGIVTDALHLDDLMDKTLEFAKGLKKEKAVVQEMKKRLYKDIVHALVVEDPACVASEDFYGPWMALVQSLNR